MPTSTEVPVSPELLDQVLLACPRDAVLVGGQATMLWALHYGIQMPDGDPLTADIDFLGDSDQSEKRGALNAAERIARIASGEIGKRAYAKWKIEPMDAVPHALYPDDFKTLRWPQLKDLVEGRRERFLRLLDRAK
jgi:hypothetical protein